MSTVTHTFSGGMVNTRDPIGVSGGDPRSQEMNFTEAAQITNFNIDDRGKLFSRDGYALMVAGTIHSLWSNGDICLFVEGQSLKQLSNSYTSTILRTGLTAGLPMAYCAVNNAVVYSNGVEIGILEDGADVPLSSPTRRYKALPPAGELLEFFNGRLYICTRDGIVASDPYNIEQVDERMSRIPFTGKGTLLSAVDDGIWFSHGNATAFLAGGDLVDLEYRHAAHYGAIRGTAVKMNAELIGIDGFSGNVVVWASDRGICVGGNGGQFANISQGKVSYPPGKTGAGMLREYNGIVQYIASMRDTGTAYNPYQ